MKQITRARRLVPFFAVMLGVCILTVAPTSAIQWNEGMTPCERTALLAFRACNVDSNEESLLKRANCLTIADPDDRMDCRVEAEIAKWEAREECGEVREAREELCETLDEYRYDPDPLLDPENTFIHPDSARGAAAANPLLSLAAGQIRVIGSEDEIVVILTTDETREIHGVECRIVAELAMEIEEEFDDGEIEFEYLPVEQTFDYYAQTTAGDIVYCGENTVEFEDEFPTSTDGTFIAGEEDAKSGYLVRMAPAVGDADRQEFFLDDAEDWVMYLDLGASVPDEFGGEVEDYECDGDCVQTVEGTPLEADVIEWKFHLPGVGFVLALPFELNDDDEWEWTGEREELLCTGDSLDILTDGTCDVDDGEELLRAVCANAGDWFCED